MRNRDKWNTEERVGPAARTAARGPSTHARAVFPAAGQGPTPPAAAARLLAEPMIFHKRGFPVHVKKLQYAQKWGTPFSQPLDSLF